MEGEGAQPEAQADERSAGEKVADAEPAQRQMPAVEVSRDRAERAHEQANFLGARLDDLSIVIQGDVVGRDKVVQDHQKAAEPMPPRTLRKYIRYAAPLCIDEVRSRLADERFVVLAAEPGWGKYALGVNLLNELGAAPHVIDRDADLRSLPGWFKKGKGYLVADVAVQRLLELSRDDIELIADVAELNEALLVITTAGDGNALRSSFRNHLPDLGEPSPVEAVLKAHLRSATTSARVEDLFADSRVLDRLRTCETRAEVCDLAAELMGSSRDLALDGLTTQAKQHLRTEVNTWLAGLDDEQWPYVFAMAVLDGTPRDVAVRGGADLSRFCRLGALERDKRIGLLDDIRVHSALEQWHTPLGQVPMQVVRCKYQRHRPLVVDLVWEHGAQLRGPMLRWLRRMGEHEEPRVVLAAGAAVGQLALHDFVTVLREVLEPWAGAEKAETREAAVAAFSIIASDERFVPSLLKLATRWVLGSSAEKWTAVRVFGRPLGTHSLDKALLRFKHSCAKLDSSIAVAVADSVVELAIDGEPAQLSRLLDALVEWSCDERPALRTAAVFVFLRMCVDVMDMTAALPRLLRTGDARATAAVASLWARAITHPDLHETSVKVARLWARQCETHSRGPDLLAVLFGLAGQLPRERRLVRAMADSWTNHKKPPLMPRCAQAVRRAVEHAPERDAG